jgi:hypothetical protein
MKIVTFASTGLLANTNTVESRDIDCPALKGTVQLKHIHNANTNLEHKAKLCKFAMAYSNPPSYVSNAFRKPLRNLNFT